MSAVEPAIKTPDDYPGDPDCDGRCHAITLSGHRCANETKYVVDFADEKRGEVTFFLCGLHDHWLIKGRRLRYSYRGNEIVIVGKGRK